VCVYTVLCVQPTVLPPPPASLSSRYFKVSKAEESKLRSKLKGAYAPFEVSAGGVKFRSAELLQV
jgi:hypothetical protein